MISISPSSVHKSEQPSISPFKQPIWWVHIMKPLTLDMGHCFLLKAHWPCILQHSDQIHRWRKSHPQLDAGCRRGKPSSVLAGPPCGAAWLWWGSSLSPCPTRHQQHLYFPHQHSVETSTHYPKKVTVCVIDWKWSSEIELKSIKLVGCSEAMIQAVYIQHYICRVGFLPSSPFLFENIAFPRPTYTM